MTVKDSADTQKVYDYKTGERLPGKASKNLVVRSTAPGYSSNGTGAVKAYLDDGIWECCPEWDAARLGRIGYRVETVYVQ